MWGVTTDQRRDPRAATIPAQAGPQPARRGWDRRWATVLFVDDEPMVLAGLRRSLHQVRPDWRSLFAEDGVTALQIMAAEPVDVVISDMRMPGMSGAQLLAEVRRTHPATARIILSGYSDRDTVIKAVGPAQQFLTKPCDGGELISALDRVLALHDLVASPKLRDVLGGVSALPKPPEIYHRIIAITSDPDYDLNDVITVIESDLTTTAEVLRLVNSSFFGLSARVSSIAQAVNLLGPSTVHALAVSGSVFTSAGGLPPGLDAGVLASHGLLVAGIARRVAHIDGWSPDAVSDIFMAGLLHQIGLPVLAAAQPDRWIKVQQAPAADIWAEHEVYSRHFGGAPTEASAYLLGLWGFPEPVVRAVAEQPTRPDDPNATPAGLLLSHARHRILSPTVPFPTSADGYLTAARAERWNGEPVPEPAP